MKQKQITGNKTRAVRKSLDFYLSLQYRVTTEPSPEGGYFVEITDLPGCFAEGDTIEEAYVMIEIARKLWIESMYEDGNDIPIPRSEDEYSGKFNVRLPKSLHRKLDSIAVKEGVSLNQYLVSTLSLAVGQTEAAKKKKK